MFEMMDWQAWLDWAKRRWRWLAAVGLAGLLLVFLVLLMRPKHVEMAEPATLKAGGRSTATKPAAKTGSAANEKMKSSVKVDVKGAVKKPGLYVLSADARLADAIEKAGGLTAEADANALNLAQLLEDGMAVYVLKVGETAPEIKNAGTHPGGGVSASQGTAAEGASAGKIHLNAASQKELESLTGVGPKKAEQIIAYREEHPFQSVDELKEISGIGPKRFEQLKDQVQP
ncbi:helix-hairpin-helix domain-containing protein [Fructobacillus sp. M1-13]|uniref:Helix-hairpin-helix DNA-binding motif class 1 domain-containing protein n=1 Tax=Fructobacillus papyriferae TaxID=2713171 RepID=A0ABS5QP31_9LACO|nr:helix-hairpin-helix domain-containing protein [Fructobacillus papyriferae]MBS9334918.1 hypothetical protein [Fructobacillus papyriferae]MCD2159598.1 helix-hairpin-helix domain-containing protein [Fructobacillus papyriferae]